ncbi:phosphoadenylyl-sulfate reductase [Paraconexibacter sp.]|uniref:phosphoadenylyl-sulfate reductase n=1 Tax=Paraconexibacter sp. TaxID=2949640 RepID=UPI00356A530A
MTHLGADTTRTLQDAVSAHGGDGLVLLCSFQKEESVIVDELARLGALDRVRVVTIDTGVLFPETLQTWKAFEDRWGLTVHVEDASAPEGVEPWSGPEHCCGAQKVAALERALSGAQAWITGIRREQAPTRSGAQLVEADEKRGGIPKFNPLAAWTEKDLWTRIFERELPYHPLHDRDYSSIGCAPCTKPGSGREGRWAGTEKTECGLHV